MASHPEDAGPGTAGKRAELTQAEGEGPGTGRREAQRLLDDVEPLRGDLAEKFEGHMQTLIVHPPHRPSTFTQAAQQGEDLLPGRIGDRHRDKEPHQAVESGAIVSSAPRR
jgi:hypothetical protein